MHRQLLSLEGSVYSYDTYMLSLEDIILHYGKSCCLEHSIITYWTMCYLFLKHQVPAIFRRQHLYSGDFTFLEYNIEAFLLAVFSR